MDTISTPQNAIPSTFAPTLALASILFAPIGGTIGIFVAAAMQQLPVRLVVGENNRGFASTFKVASCTKVTALVSWIPIVGPLVALYSLYLSGDRVRPSFVPSPASRD